MSPLLSVILPVFNQEKYLVETIESILNQSFGNFELIILDDGSTDSSARIIERFASADNRIRAYYEANSGKSNATNFLVEKALGEWCVFLDADDVMLAERLKKQLAFHLANREIDASSCHCYYINEEGNMFGTQRYPGLNSVAEFKQTMAEERFITCSYTGLMVSRRVFMETGGLITKFEPCEDFEFFNRLADKGYILLTLPEILMKYRIHADAITVRKPFLVRETITFVKECINLRRAGKPEISFEEFSMTRNGQPWLKKFNRNRFDYSIIHFRSAGLALLSKKYLFFILKISLSFILSPNYVIKKARNQLKK